MQDQQVEQQEQQEHKPLEFRYHTINMVGIPLVDTLRADMLDVITEILMAHPDEDTLISIEWYTSAFVSAVQAAREELNDMKNLQEKEQNSEEIENG